MVTQLTQSNFMDIKKMPIPVIIDAYAEWCPPCQKMEPIFSALAQELGDSYAFTKLNVDIDRDIAIELGIASVPTFVFMSGGTVLGTETGSMSKDALQNMILDYFKASR